MFFATMGIYNIRASNIMFLIISQCPPPKTLNNNGKDYLNVTTSWANNYDQPIKNKSFSFIDPFCNYLCPKTPNLNFTTLLWHGCLSMLYSNWGWNKDETGDQRQGWHGPINKARSFWIKIEIFVPINNRGAASTHPTHVGQIIKLKIPCQKLNIPKYF